MSKKKATIRMEFENEEAHNIERLKVHYGIKATTELIRLLITEKANELNNKKSGNLPSDG